MTFAQVLLEHLAANFLRELNSAQQRRASAWPSTEEGAERVRKFALLLGRELSAAALREQLIEDRLDLEVMLPGERRANESIPHLVRRSIESLLQSGLGIRRGDAGRDFRCSDFVPGLF